MGLQPIIMGRLSNLFINLVMGLNPQLEVT